MKKFKIENIQLSTPRVLVPLQQNVSKLLNYKHRLSCFNNCSNQPQITQYFRSAKPKKLATMNLILDEIKLKNQDQNAKIVICTRFQDSYKSVKDYFEENKSTSESAHILGEGRPI